MNYDRNCGRNSWKYWGVQFYSKGLDLLQQYLAANDVLEAKQKAIQLTTADNSFAKLAPI